jgi:hypothetical protein
MKLSCSLLSCGYCMGSFYVVHTEEILPKYYRSTGYQFGAIVLEMCIFFLVPYNIFVGIWRNHVRTLNQKLW